MQSADNRNNSLDLLRFIAALLVVYGHLVWSATYATDIQNLVGSGNLPLIPENTHYLWKLQYYFGKLTYNSHITVIGVAIFFLVTGWLTPDMMAKYGRTSYLINRFFRIIPLLVFATLLCAAILMAIESTPISPMSLIGSSTTFSRELGVVLLLPVVWTLAIEIKFYFLSAVVGRWTTKKLGLASLACWAAFNLGIYGGGTTIIIAHDLHFILFILVGIGIRLSIDSKSVAPFFITITIFNLSRLNYATSIIEPHQNFTRITQAIAITIFGLCIYNSRRISNGIRSLANLTYSIYLLHLNIGFAIMYTFRSYMSPTVLVFLAAGVIFILATFSYKYIEVPFISLGKKLSQAKS